MSLDITCGNPEAGPASYSRFVLPFAYCSEEWKDLNEVPDVHYARVERSDAQIWRERYLTHEISDVLFHRARWFRLAGRQPCLQVPMKFRDCTQGGGINVCMSSPVIVLFEWPGVNPDLRDPRFEFEGLLHTGFLIVELYFSEPNFYCPTLDTLIELNELFRYWQQPYNGHEEKKHGEDKGRSTYAQYKKLLQHFPFRIEAKETIGSKTAAEDLYFERWASLLEIPIKEGDGKCWRLFPKPWGDTARSYVSGRKSESPGWAIYADSRTFVWTCAITKDGGSDLKKIFLEQKRKVARENAQFMGLLDNYIERRPEGSASEFGHWVKLLNVDPPGKDPKETNGSRDFERKWANERTYKRWEEWGTYYGFSYHSGAMLGPPLKEPDGPPLWMHFGQMYFDQVLLLLYVRVSLFRFSLKLNEISSKALDRKDDGQADWRNHFQDLRWHFALFTNLYQFPLLSNQQQAVEMYSIARKVMDIDVLFDEIQKEIYGSHEYVTMKEGKEQSERVERLTVVATVGLIFALAASILSMVILESPEDFQFSQKRFLVFVLVLISCMGMIMMSLVLATPITKIFNKLSSLISWKKGGVNDK